MPLKSLLAVLLFLLIGWLPARSENDILYDSIPYQKLGFVLPDGVHKLKVPFELNNNLIVIKILLNNAIPLKFILDTGVRTTVLTEKTFTDLLNLNYSRKITIPGVGGEKLVDAYVANNITLKIDDMVGTGHALIVLEEDLLQLKNYLGSSVHGILGYELFSRFVVEINYSSKIVTFHDPDHYKKKRNFYEYELEIIDTKPYLKVDFNLKDSTVHHGKFMVDTGASHSFLVDKFADSTYYIPQPAIYSHLGRGLGGELFGYISRLDQVSVEPFSFKGVVTTFPDTASYLVDLIRTPRDGTIGGGLLTRFVVIFDYVHEKLYLKKGKSYKKPFEYNLSGLIVKAKGLRLDIYEIVEVREGSSAQMAGALPGDEIILVNGHYTKDLELNELLGLINYRVNKLVRMVVLRNGIKTKILFRLERQV